ncbi:MAG TPA: hypothetical protein VNN13_12970 [Methylomirabilota bacterium]|nr:hypothetical protein [Methylomirabilota bacterium]
MRFRDRGRTTSSSTGHGRSLPFGADLGKQEPSIALLGFFRDHGNVLADGLRRPLVARFA